MLNSFLLMIRSALFYVGYVVVTIIMSLLFILVFPLLPPIGRYRFVSTWCVFVLQWLRVTCGVRYVVSGEEHLATSPAVFLSNHQSSWETVLFYKLIFPMSPILKKELFNIPFWGWALRLLRPIAIDRSKPREAGKSLLVQGEQRLREGNSIIIFPEGTRSEPGQIRKFSRGGATLAAAAKVPIVPIVHNAGYVWPPRRFIKQPGTVTVKIGGPLQASDRSVSELTDSVEQWVRENFVARDY